MSHNDCKICTTYKKAHRDEMCQHSQCTSPSNISSDKLFDVLREKDKEISVLRERNEELLRRLITVVDASIAMLTVYRNKTGLFSKERKDCDETIKRLREYKY